MEIKKNDLILVTGGTGFLGRYIIKELYTRGYSRILSIGSKDVDLKNEIETNTLFNILKPLVIIHAAALCGGIGANKDNPVQFLENNVKMNLNVVSSALKLWNNNSLKKFIGIGTVCSYPKYAPIPFREEDLWNGAPEETNWSYGESKRLFLLHLMSCIQQYKFPATFLIPVNMYGPNDSFDDVKSHVIPALIKKIAYARFNNINEVQCWGTGNASREFFYVEDCATAICDSMEKYNELGPINLGSGVEIKISDLANMISEIIGYDGKLVWDASKPDGQPRRCLDISKAFNYFGFKAKTNIKDGLEQTVKWFLDNKVEINIK